MGELEKKISFKGEIKAKGAFYDSEQSLCLGDCREKSCF